MTGERWQALSAWHNAWLDAGPDERRRLRQRLAVDAPDLIADADRLISETGALDGFLETPAIVLAANELAAREAATANAAARTDSAGGRHARWVVAALAIAALAAAAGWHLRPTPATPRARVPLARLTVPLPPGLEVRSPPAVSPDGQRLVLAAGNSAGTRLLLHDLAAADTIALDGTDGASAPSWSSDGRWIAFSAGGRLMKMTPGKAPSPIDGATGNWGGAWSPSGAIVFQPAVRNAGLLSVPAEGGRPAVATILDDAAGDVSHRFPVALPDGRSLFYYLDSTDARRRGLYLTRLDRQPTPASRGRRLARLDGPAIYVDVPGDADLVLRAVGGRVEVWSFDPSRLELGDRRVVALDAAPPIGDLPALLSATSDVLAFVTADPAPREIGVVIGWRALLR